MIYNKPAGDVFASQANTGESADFPDVLRGWGITKEQTEGKPPMSWMNGAFKRVDENVEYLRQNGIAEWDEKLTYPIGAITRSGSELYVCITENANQNPVASNSWKKLIQLSSAIDSTSETTAATSKAVSDALATLGTAALRNVGTGTNQIPDMSSFTHAFDGGTRHIVTIPVNDGISRSVAASINLPTGITDFTFPIPFPNLCYCVLITQITQDTAPTGNLSARLTGANTVRFVNWSGTGVTAQYFAMGR